jgi:hypothetical protein
MNFVERSETKLIFAVSRRLTLKILCRSIFKIKYTNNVMFITRNWSSVELTKLDNSQKQIPTWEVWFDFHAHVLFYECKFNVWKSVYLLRICPFRSQLLFLSPPLPLAYNTLNFFYWRTFEIFIKLPHTNFRFPLPFFFSSHHLIKICQIIWSKDVSDVFLITL